MTSALTEICLWYHVVIGKSGLAPGLGKGACFTGKMTWELGFGKYSAAVRRWSVFQVEAFVEIQSHDGAVCCVWVGIGADKGAKDDCEQILRFLRHPKDCSFFLQTICIHGLYLYVYPPFNKKVLCKQTLSCYLEYIYIF